MELGQLRKLDIVESIEFKERVLNMTFNAIYVYDLIDGTNVYINKQYTELTGYTINDVNAMSPEEFFSLFHPEDQELIGQHMQEINSLGINEVLEVEYRFKKANGDWMWCYSKDMLFSVGDDGLSTQFIGSFIDVTEKKNAEIALKELNNNLESIVKQRTLELEDSLGLQKLLFKEAHHRVKNNLQLLISLFNLYLDNVEDESVTSAIKNCQDKIYSLALVHKKLYQSKDIGNIDFADYLKNLCLYLEKSVNVNDNVTTKLNLSPIKIQINKAVSLGLIVNELITNSFKHAFKGRSSGELLITLNKQEAQLVLSIKDNGIGLDESFDINSSDSLGMTIISALSEQIDAKLIFENSNNGLEWKLVLAIDNEK